MCDENIEYKKCINCEESKELNVKNFEFRKDNNCYRNSCRKCDNLRRKTGSKKRNQLLLEKIESGFDFGHQVCKTCGKDFPLDLDHYYINGGTFCLHCRWCCIEEVRLNELANPTAKERVRKWREQFSPEELKSYQKNLRIINREKYLEAGRKHYNKNKDKINARNRLPENRKKAQTKRNIKYHTDEQYRLKNNLRGRVHAALKNQHGIKFGKTEELIGTSYVKFTQHLESQFDSGMTWKNRGYGYGNWTVEHIVPCEAFDLQREDHQYKCFHWSNCKPMWFEENLKKNDLINYNGKTIRARTLTKQQKHAYIASLNLPPYDVPNHNATPYNPLINQIKLDLPIQTLTSQTVNNPIIIATNLPIRAPIIRRIDLVS